MASYWHLQQKQQRLKKQISSNLDFLTGSVTTKGPARTGHNLTFKVNQVTKSRHIRKSMLAKVKQMTRRYKTMKILMQDLSSVNWELLKKDSEVKH